MPKYRLTKYQQETFYHYNQEESIVYIEAMDPALIRHMEKKLGLKPITIDGWGGKTYEIPKKWLPYPRKPRKLSPETRAKLAKRMRKLAKERKNKKKGKNQQ